MGFSGPTCASQRRSVLVVDDVSATRRGLAELLRLRGYDAYEAKDGAEGIRLLRERERTSVVVLDLTMPHKDGYWFREQQLRDSSVAGIPVIVFTGSVPNERLRQLQVSDVLLKPFSVDDLFEAVERLSTCRSEY